MKLELDIVYYKVGDFSQEAKEDGYDRMYEGFGYGEGNNGGPMVYLDFVVAFELMISNSHSKKEEHL